jgi:hypothetical protein
MLGLLVAKGLGESCEAASTSTSLIFQTIFGITDLLELTAEAISSEVVVASEANLASEEFPSEANSDSQEFAYGGIFFLGHTVRPQPELYEFCFFDAVLLVFACVWII